MQSQVINVILFYMDKCVEFLPGGKRLLAGEDSERELKRRRCSWGMWGEGRNWCPGAEQKV